MDFVSIVIRLFFSAILGYCVMGILLGCCGAIAVSILYICCYVKIGCVWKALSER